MTEYKFIGLINMLVSYFNAKSSILDNSGMIGLWRMKVERVPDAATNFLFEKITNDYERMPQNLPKAMMEHLSAYYALNPIDTEQHGCDECFCGYLSGVDKSGFSKSFLCSNCHRLPRFEGELRFSIHDIEARGYAVRRKIRAFEKVEGKDIVNNLVEKMEVVKWSQN